jgi:hypothetical protein
MAEEENTKSLDDEIQGVIRTNQTLLRKKGLLKRLLEDSAIQHLLKQVLKYDKNVTSDEEKLLEEDEKKLLEELKTNQFNLDKTIEGIVESAAKKMKGELINDKMMKDIETPPQPDEEIPEPDIESSQDLESMTKSTSPTDIAGALEKGQVKADKEKLSIKAYLLYANEEKLKEDNKDKSATEIEKMASAQWKGLKDKDKKKYVDMVTEKARAFMESSSSSSPTEEEEEEEDRLAKEAPGRLQKEGLGTLESAPPERPAEAPFG